MSRVMSWKRSSLVLLITAAVVALPYWIMHGAGLRQATHVISATGAVDPDTLMSGGLYVLCFVAHWTVVPILVIGAGLSAVAIILQECRRHR